MSRSKILTGLCVLVVLALAIPVMAGTFQTTLNITNTSKIGSLTLQPGSYQLVVNDTKATVKKGKKVLGEVNCQWTEGSEKAYVDTLMYDKDRIIEFRVGGKTRVLKFQ